MDNPNALSSDGLRPLDTAARINDAARAAALLDAGAEPGLRNRRNSTAMHIAAGHGSIDVLKLLVASGRAPLNAVGPNGLTPLGYAMYNGRHECAAFLRSVGAKGPRGDPADDCPPSEDVQLGHLREVLASYSPEGIDLPRVLEVFFARFGYTPQFGGSFEQYLQAALPDAVFAPGRKPGSFVVSLAPAQPPPTVIEATAAPLAAEPVIRHTIVGGPAVVSNQDQKVLLLLAAHPEGIDMSTFPRVFEQYFCDKLHYPPHAFKSYLLSLGVTVAPGKTPGNDIVRLKQKTIESFRKYSISTRSFVEGDPNQLLRSGNRLLNNAARCNRVEDIAVLLEAGADPKIQSMNGETPLHSAAEGGALEALQLFVASGQADINVLDSTGFTPLDIAVAAKQDECAEFLRSVGAKGSIVPQELAAPYPDAVPLQQEQQLQVSAPLASQPSEEMQVAIFRDIIQSFPLGIELNALLLEFHRFTGGKALYNGQFKAWLSRVIPDAVLTPGDVFGRWNVRLSTQAPEPMDAEAQLTAAGLLETRGLLIESLNECAGIQDCLFKNSALLAAAASDIRARLANLQAF